VFENDSNLLSRYALSASALLVSFPATLPNACLWDGIFPLSNLFRRKPASFLNAPSLLQLASPFQDVLPSAIS